MKIIIDSTCYLDEEFIRKHNIDVASLHIVVNGESFEEVSVDNEFVFKQLNEGNKVSTSAVAPAVFESMFNKYPDETILVFPLSAGISATYQSAMIAKEMVDREDVYVFNTLVCAYGNENIVIQIVKAIEEGKTEKEVINQAYELSDNAEVLFTLTTLEHVVRGGRISKVSAAIANIVGIKPVIEMVDGKLLVTRKSRTHKKIVNNFIIKEIKEHAENFSKLYLRIIDLKQDDFAQQIKSGLKDVVNIEITHTKYIGPVFSYHLGEEGYGITWTAVK